VLIGKDGALSQAQAEVVLTDEQERKRIRTLSASNLAGEIRSAMRKNPENLLTQALGTVLLVAYNEGKRTSSVRPEVPGAYFQFPDKYYCYRTGPNRPKVGRSKKKTELKRSGAAAKEAAL